MGLWLVPNPDLPISLPVRVLVVGRGPDDAILVLEDEFMEGFPVLLRKGQDVLAFVLNDLSPGTGWLGFVDDDGPGGPRNLVPGIFGDDRGRGVGRDRGCGRGIRGRRLGPEVAWKKQGQ